MRAQFGQQPGADLAARRQPAVEVGAKPAAREAPRELIEQHVAGPAVHAEHRAGIVAGRRQGREIGDPADVDREQRRAPAAQQPPVDVGHERRAGAAGRDVVGAEIVHHGTLEARRQVRRLAELQAGDAVLVVDRLAVAADQVEPCRMALEQAGQRVGEEPAERRVAARKAGKILQRARRASAARSSAGSGTVSKASRSKPSAGAEVTRQRAMSRPSIEVPVISPATVRTGRARTSADRITPAPRKRRAYSAGWIAGAAAGAPRGRTRATPSATTLQASIASSTPSTLPVRPTISAISGTPSALRPSARTNFRP